MHGGFVVDGAIIVLEKDGFSLKKNKALATCKVASIICRCKIVC